VVRHNLVQQIIRAYEDYDMAHPQRGGNSSGSAANGKAAKGTAAEASKDPDRENQRA
jgi:hypothetical protein